MCCGSRQAGHRIGEHLEKVIPLVVKFSRVEDDELREYCLQAFESFVRRCPKDISPHIPMVKLCSRLCSYVLDADRVVSAEISSGKFPEIYSNLSGNFQKFVNYLCQAAVYKSNIAK